MCFGMGGALGRSGLGAWVLCSQMPQPASLPARCCGPGASTPITCRQTDRQRRNTAYDDGAGWWCSESEPSTPIGARWAARATPRRAWARADHGRIACSCQPFHFWAVTHFGHDSPSALPLQKQVKIARVCVPEMGQFSIHRRLPAFQPSSVMVTRACTGTGMGSGQPNPTRSQHTRLPHPLSLTVSGQVAVHDPHGLESQNILGQPPRRRRR
jgi:hypothetical protein